MLFATGVGLFAGTATILSLMLGGALISAVPIAWLAAVAPIAAALIAAAATGSLLHWRKVSGRGVVHSSVITTALLVLFAAQLVRFADLTAFARAAGLDALRSAAAWREAVDVGVLFPSETAGVVPGLAAITGLVGADALWIFAVTELALIIGLAWWMAGRAVSAPFCAACGAWCVRQRGVVERNGDAAAPEVVRQRAAARDWHYFRALGPARGGPSLRFDLARCPRCTRSNQVSVMWERPMWRDRCLVGDLRLGADDIRTLLTLVETGPQPI